MRNFSLSKLQYLLLALLLTALAGCGTSNTASTSNAGSGKIAASLVWGDGTAKTTAKTVAAVPAGIDTIRMTVTGTSDAGTPIPLVRSDIAVTPGVTSGTINGVYPGKVTLAVQALQGGAVKYEGYYIGAVVTAGNTTDVGTITMAVPIVKAEDASCLSCHDSALDKTGQNLIANYKQSGHYTNINTGCSACHGSNHNDLNPSASGKCFTCHGTLGAHHTGSGTNAKFLSAGNNNCNACHEPHNPIDGIGKQERRDWKASGHGDVTALPWADRDFSASADCNACHTPTGFVKAMGNGWTDTTAVNTGKQPLNCDGCHSDNDFKVRALPGSYAAGMGGFGAGAKATISFPDVGESNICIPCHAGRENTASLKAAVAITATTGSFKNPHYLAAASVFYGKGGFRFYGDDGKTGTPAVNVTTPAGTTYSGNVPAYSSEYGVVVDGIIVTSTNAGKTPVGTGTLTGRYANWSHGKLGMDNYTTSSTVTGNVRGSGNKGQCVACHLGPKNTHTFNAYKAAEDTWRPGTTVGGCYGCHNNENMEEVGDLEEKPLFDRLMAFYDWNLAQVGITFNNAVYPYMLNGSGTGFSAWNTAVGTAGTVDAQRLQGAAMNRKLLAAEYGAHVHNRGYMRQLVFDSIQYLQFGATTYSNSKFYATTGSANLENVLKFSAYSTALAATPDTIKNSNGTVVSISQLKGYIISSSSNTTPIDLATGVAPTATYGTLKYFRR